MSLVGNLEDLGLGDILQIVSLSRKSGVLFLQSQGREGKIIFQNGQVTQATSTVFRENLGDLLVRRGVADVDSIKQALLRQKATSPAPRIGAILAEHYAVDKSTIEEVAKNQVEKIVYSFFAWSEGAFSFELGEPSELGATNFNPLQFMLDQGLNPQWLAMEGSRLLDEQRHRGEPVEDPDAHRESLFDVEELLGETGTTSAVATPGEGAVVTETALSGRLLLLIDDDETTREEFGKVLRQRGFDTGLFSSPLEFMTAAAAAQQEGQHPLLLVDLIMPRMDGSGILGGLELLEELRSQYPGLNVLVLSDHANPDAERKVVQLGYPPVVPKPKKNEVREQRGGLLLQKLGDTVAGLIAEMAAKVPSPSASTFNLGVELLKEMGESEGGPRPSKGPESPGLHLLRGMLQELNNPSLGGGITLLVLRFASELMNRAIIFLVKEQEVVGLGQFGIESTDEIADVRVRRMKVPRGQDSVFSTLLQEMTPMKVKLGSGRWDRYLAEQLGGGDPVEVFLGPITSEGKVVAVLYGDNLPEKAPIGDTESLEIFLSQAGLAMEKALLERRLRGKEASG